MAIRAEYNDRVLDVNSYFDILSFEDAVETYRQKPIVNTDQGQQLLINNTMQKCMRANAIILLYNLVESTFCNCVQLIYDAISDEHLTYTQVTHELRKVWIDLSFEAEWHVDAVRKHAKDLSDHLHSAVLSYSDMPAGTSGNLDFAQMVEISKKFGINFGYVPDVEEVKKTLLFVKTNRNDLAHGNVSYSTVGASVSLGELINHKTYTMTFLNHCIGVYEQYVQQKRYKYSL
ncbi:MAG: hypothetical protein K6A94_04945 [Bacteroidales bacterium]|nr:hypothetical protein [Bacteroidales bacterium]